MPRTLPAHPSVHLLPYLSCLVEDCSSILQSFRDKHDVPGMSALVWQGGNIVAQGVCGVRKRGENSPIQRDDIFHLGSNTKAMTATMIATIVDEGEKLAWDTTVSQVFPELESYMHPHWQHATLSHLLTNCSGAPANVEPELWSSLWSMWYQGSPPSEQRLALVKGLIAEKPVFMPGSSYLYSNAGFTIAGAMVERVTNETWENLMHERLFKPLQMTSAGFGVPRSTSSPASSRSSSSSFPSSLQPIGHNEDGSPCTDGQYADNPPAIGPAATVHASLNDWAKFVAIHTRFDAAGLRLPTAESGAFMQRLSPSTISLLHTVPPSSQQYAMGWVRARAGAYNCYYHSGSNSTFYALAMFVPAKDFFLLAATNQGGDSHAVPACESVLAELTKEYLQRG